MSAIATIENALAAYDRAKALHPTVIIMVLVGDYYETFDQDAKDAAKIIGLTLTERDGRPMAGMPYHSIERYLVKLVEAARKVALVDPA